MHVSEEVSLIGTVDTFPSSPNAGDVVLSLAAVSASMLIWFIWSVFQEG